MDEQTQEMQEERTAARRSNRDTNAREVMQRFTRAALIRAVRTIAQTALSYLGTAALVSDVDWKTVVSVSIMAGICSVLTSVCTGLPETELDPKAGRK